MKLFKEFSIISLIYLSIIISTSYHTATTPPDDTFKPGAFHVGLMFPIMIPLFLYFLEEQLIGKKNENF